jgi:ABC-type uncharacterized transport system involved in gliding motility auxiliary subunit
LGYLSSCENADWSGCFLRSSRSRNRNYVADRNRVRIIVGVLEKLEVVAWMARRVHFSEIRDAVIT